MANMNTDPLLEAFLYESNSLLEKAELILVDCEARRQFDEEAINEIFRVMHTIKGSSAMMEYGMLSKTAHKVEDLFFFIRDKDPELDFMRLSDIVLAVLDEMKVEIERIEAGEPAAMDASDVVDGIEAYLKELHSSEAGAPADLTAAGNSSTVNNSESVSAGLTNSSEDKSPAASTAAPVFSNTNVQMSHARGIPDADDSVAENAQDYDYQVWMNFDENCQMENLRAFTAVTRLEEVARILSQEPADLDADDVATPFVHDNGFTAWLDTRMSPQELLQYLESNVLYVKNVEVYEPVVRQPLRVDSQGNGVNSSVLDEQMRKLTAAERDMIGDSEIDDETRKLMGQSISADKNSAAASGSANGGSVATNGTDQKVAGVRSLAKQNFISVNVNKLDMLMNVVGELVISEMMVINHPEIAKLTENLKGFEKAANQLKKITSELQDIVMSIRMVPIGGTFQSMQRIVRDMSRKLNKQVILKISGEETEVDKNVIDSISDPLMHLIRNSLDHGLEPAEVRAQVGKPEVGTIFLEARTEGGDVWLTVRDDGRGMNRDSIIKKARENGLIDNDGKDLTDREVWNYVLMPGFSTKEEVTEYSGRGVGMDVVTKNLEKIGGKLSIDSEPGKGTAFQIKIPLTLAIIDGMEITVSNKRYTIPITLIREAFRVRDEKLIMDSDGNELIMIRGKSHEVIRLHRTFDIKDAVTDLAEGILLVVEHESRNVCIFADQLVGEHQVVVKPVPIYLGHIEGVTGCTILGDGTISLILDINGLVERQRREGGK
ncbi:MAG: chemotaxis protein CheA [Eubacteriales bacterium]|nr:chemotaxis protein CheA [Eubacteriales bacterium]